VFGLQHIIISDKDGNQELVVESQLPPASEISDDVRSFCDVFSLPLSERPLPGLVLSVCRLSSPCIIYINYKPFVFSIGLVVLR